MLINIKSVLQDILQTNKDKIRIQKAQLRPRHNNTTNKATTAKETKTKTKEMPKNNIPYSPNDYWDRTRFSSSSSDPDKSPSHSIASLPHHPRALSITSTSPSRNNQIPPPSSRGRSSSQRTYAQELQLRSRSPKLFELRPQDKADTSKNGGGRDPATQLGGFQAVNPRTSRVGDQELPWKLSIPGDSTTDTAAAAADGDNKHDKHPQRGQIRAINEGQPPVELPEHKDKDDEGEEIVMSSTAYPGQEWRPDGLSQWEYW